MFGGAEFHTHSLTVPQINTSQYEANQWMYMVATQDFTSEKSARFFQDSKFMKMVPPKTYSNGHGLLGAQIFLIFFLPVSSRIRSRLTVLHVMGMPWALICNLIQLL